MNKINVFMVFWGMFLLSSNYALSQERYYYAFDERIFLNEVPDRFVLSFDSRYLPEIQASLQKDTRIRHIELQVANNGSILTTENLDFKTIKEYFSKQAGIKSITPMYITVDGGSEMGVTNEIVVQFKKNVSQQEMDEMHKRFNIEIKKVTELFLLLSVPFDFDPLDVANAYQRSGLVNFSHPNFLAQIQTAQLPTDPYFIHQYYLRNIGQTINGRTSTAGADINVVPAWNITKGSSNIVVAVLDQGVTSNHPDLPNTRQVRLSGGNFTDGNPNDPSPTGNMNHGNACAGIIAASHNNEGIAGIAPNCKIMPVRIFHSIDPITNNPVGGFQPATIAAAITFAKDEGADIISNSWHVFGTSPTTHPVIVSAIEDAVNNGRDGNGCVFVFVTGNDANHISNLHGTIDFPATVTISGVLTVGASDRNDVQANYSPSSNLNSPNNQIIDIVAPSHRASSYQIPTETDDVWTIDIPTNDGYNPVKRTDHSGWGSLPIPGTYLPNSGTNYLAYTGHFGGTSAAAPQVAGVAALILSINPDLTQLQVSEIIKSTARKAGNYVYQIELRISDVNTWNPRMGHGVVDAYAAVQATCATLPPFINFVNQPVTISKTLRTCGDINIEGVTISNDATLTLVAAGDINVQNVTVTSGATLILDAGGEVNVISDLDIQTGADYEIR